MRELLSRRGSAVRDLVESIVFDADANAETRRLLVEGMAQRGDADANALLAALLRQSADPVLQYIAIGAVAEGAAPEVMNALRYARSWSPSFANRRAATEACARVGMAEDQTRFLAAQALAGTAYDRASATTALEAMGVTVSR